MYSPTISHYKENIPLLPKPVDKFSYREYDCYEKIHACRCKSLVCDYMIKGCLIGTLFTSVCWIPGTVMWSLPTASTTMIVAGKVLTGMGSTLTSLACCGGCIYALHSTCMDIDTNPWFETY